MSLDLSETMKTGFLVGGPFEKGILSIGGNVINL